jgi:hypothetical protein
MHRLSTLTLSLLAILLLAGVCQSQETRSPYLVRMERQTREEDVCMLVSTDGHYHLERVVATHPRVFEGTLASPALTELEPLLTANQLADLKQSQIESTSTGGDIDQVMLTIPRPKGWQTLTFPNPRSRKPFRSEIDPILQWLDRNKQQQDLIAGAMSTRCMPSQTTRAPSGLASPSASNPYIMRIVIDHYEPAGSGTAFSSVSAAKGTTAGPVGGRTNIETMDVNSFKITRTCGVVYESGRYRFEKSVRDEGKLTRSDIYRDTLSKPQLDELRQILGNPKLAALPNNVAPTFLGREGDLISLTVLRDKNLQAVGFISAGPLPPSAYLQDSSLTALSANVGLTNPIRKWVKQNLEDNKGALVKDVPASTCVPSAQPE